MSLFFRPKPFKDKFGKHIHLHDLEILEYGVLNDEVSVEFTLFGKYLKGDEVSIEGTGTIEELQEEIERLWNGNNKTAMIYLTSKLKEIKH